MDVALAHWSASVPVLVVYVVLAGLHVVGLRRILAEAQPDSRPELLREAGLFQLGLAAIMLAFVSPVGYWSTVYVSARAGQELFVAVVVPALLVLGSPWQAFGLSRERLSWLVARPVLAVTVANLVWLAWLVPALTDAVHGDSTGAALVRLAEYASFVGAGMLFWLQLVGSRPLRPRGSAVWRFGLMLSALITSTVAGMALVFDVNRLYPAYSGAVHSGMSLVNDQQLSGAVLWMGMLLPLMVAGLALLLQWFGNEESAELTADLDRLLSPRQRGWPSRPVIR